MTTNLLKLSVVCAAIAIVVACSAYPRTEAEFGNAVRHMVRSQTVPAPADTTPVQQGDGERQDNVLEAYRSDVSRDASPPPPVSIQFGGGAPQ